MTTAQDYVNAISKNVKDLYANAIDFVTFSERQKDLWDRADRAGLSRAVVQIIANVQDTGHETKKAQDADTKTTQARRSAIGRRSQSGRA